MITIIALLIYSLFVTIALYMIDNDIGDNIIGNTFLFIVGGPILWIIVVIILILKVIKKKKLA